MNAVDTQAALAREAPVLREDEGAVCYLTINRPNAGNSLSHAAVEALLAHLDALRKFDRVSVVVLAGAGNRFFCAGHDLKEARPGRDIEEGRDSAAHLADLVLAIRNVPQIVIAKVRGVATGGGCQIVAACDMAIASRDARFATPGVNIGLWCWGPMVSLTRCVMPKDAMNMLTRGRLFDAEHALRIGLVNEIVDAGNLDATVREIANEIGSKSSYTLALGKQAFYRQLEMTTEAALAYAGELSARNSQHHDAQEGIQAFIEKRQPHWIGRRSS